MHFTVYWSTLMCKVCSRKWELDIETSLSSKKSVWSIPSSNWKCHVFECALSNYFRTTYYCLNFFFFFWSTSHDIWDLSPLTRDWTLALCTGVIESWPLDCQGSLCLTLVEPERWILSWDLKDEEEWSRWQKKGHKGRSFQGNIATSSKV